MEADPRVDSYAVLDYMRWCRHAHQLSPVQLFLTPWTVATQALLSMEFSRQKYWIELPFSTSEDLPNPWIKRASWVFCTGRQILYH